MEQIQSHSQLLRSSKKELYHHKPETRINDPFGVPYPHCFHNQWKYGFTCNPCWKTIFFIYGCLVIYNWTDSSVFFCRCFWLFYSTSQIAWDNKHYCTIIDTFIIVLSSKLGLIYVTWNNFDLCQGKSLHAIAEVAITCFQKLDIQAGTTVKTLNYRTDPVYVKV